MFAGIFASTCLHILRNQGLVLVSVPTPSILSIIMAWNLFSVPISIQNLETWGLEPVHGSLSLTPFKICKHEAWYQCLSSLTPYSVKQASYQPLVLCPSLPP